MMGYLPSEGVGSFKGFFFSYGENMQVQGYPVRAVVTLAGDVKLTESKITAGTYDVSI